MKRARQILIIEDNADDQVLLMRQLKRAQVQRHVRIIHDGGEALAYLANRRFQCEDLAAVFLDLELPTLSGLKILEAIRLCSRLRDLPVIVMTSSHSPQDLEKCRELGVSSFAHKPLTFSSFAKAFADTFHARQSVSNGHNAAPIVE